MKCIVGADGGGTLANWQTGTLAHWHTGTLAQPDLREWGAAVHKITNQFSTLDFKL